MGRQEQDYLTLSNAWASVTVTRQRSDDGVTYFSLSGDVDGTHEFHTLGGAIAYAYDELAAYEQGRWPEVQS
jgi:hypothetical protein